MTSSTEFFNCEFQQKYENISNKANEIVPIENHMYVNDNKNTITKLPGTQIVCAKCDKQFSTKRGLHYHDQSVHKGILYPCDKCDYKASKTLISKDM